MKPESYFKTSEDYIHYLAESALGLEDYNVSLEFSLASSDKASQAKVYLEFDSLAYSLSSPSRLQETLEVIVPLYDQCKEVLYSFFLLNQDKLETTTDKAVVKNIKCTANEVRDLLVIALNTEEKILNLRNLDATETVKTRQDIYYLFEEKKRRAALELEKLPLLHHKKQEDTKGDRLTIIENLNKLYYNS